MNISVNQDILKKYNLSTEEFLVLYLCANNTDIEKTVNSLTEKGLCTKNLYNKTSAVVSNNTKEFIAGVIIDSDKKVIDKDSELRELADEMRQLFPAGRKAGTTYCWRDSTTIIARKLKTVIAKYDAKFTREQALDATRRYVEAFGGDYQYMQLLKYFILKQLPSGEIRSDFMSLIENPEEDTVENDFVKMR